jgi:hypothetical protein
MKRTNYELGEDMRILEALLCTLIARAGGQITLPAQEVAECGNQYGFCVQADWPERALTLSLQETGTGPQGLPAAKEFPGD